MKKEIQFMGFLSNVDSSILKLKLSNDYVIKSMTEQEGVKLVSNLDNIRPIEAVKKFSDLKCLSHSEEKRIYYISNSCEADLKMDKEGRLTEFPHFKHFNEKIGAITSIMRLFKEGNIRSPKHYYIIQHNNLPKMIMGGEYGLPFSNFIYHLDDSDILDLIKFINEIKLPFNLPYLQNAFEGYEESYNIIKMGLSFLTLMIALEVLFSPKNKQELTYRISRSIAVLLGKNLEDSKGIYKEIKELYDKRSKITHEGEYKSISQDDLLKLREYVRKSIKKIYELNKNKEVLLDLLHTKGFDSIL